MDGYLTPSIVYSPGKKNANPVPAFFFRRETEDKKVFLHYWWIEATSGQNFEINRYVLEVGHLDEAKGNKKRFNELFPNPDGLTREAILPEGKELDDYLGKFSKLAFEKKPWKRNST